MKNNLSIKLCPCLLIVLFLANSLCYPLNAQGLRHPDNTHRFWVTGGIGKTRFASLIGGVGFQPKNKNFVLSARYTVSGELIPPHSPGLRISEVGVLYGLRVNYFTFSTGVSKVWGVDRGQYIGPRDPGSLFRGDRYEKTQYSAIGVPLEARFILPLEWVGIGITAYGNLNDGHSYGGVAVSLYGGKL